MSVLTSEKQISNLVGADDPQGQVEPSARARRGFVVWLTGLPCSGKTTLAHALQRELERLSLRTEILDGDEIRRWLSPELGYAPEDRRVNVQRIGFLARLLSRNGVISLVAAISPYLASRSLVRAECEKDSVPFVEVYVTADREVLISRDVKGLYRKAIDGEITQFTGITAPYEVPPSPEIVVRTDEEAAIASCTRILHELSRRQLVDSRLLAG